MEGGRGEREGRRPISRPIPTGIPAGIHKRISFFFFLNWGDGIWMVTSRTGDGRGVGERERERG